MKLRVILAFLLALTLLAVQAPRVGAEISRTPVDLVCEVVGWDDAPDYRVWYPGQIGEHFRNAVIIVHCDATDPRLTGYERAVFGITGKNYDGYIVGLQKGDSVLTDDDGNVTWETKTTAFYLPDGSLTGNVVGKGRGVNEGLQLRLNISWQLDPAAPAGFYVLYSGEILDPGK